MSLFLAHFACKIDGCVYNVKILKIKKTKIAPENQHMVVITSTEVENKRGKDKMKIYMHIYLDLERIVDIFHLGSKCIKTRLKVVASCYRILKN